MFKLCINNKERAYSKELNEQESQDFINKKIGEKISGNSFGFKGYEFEITGGSDKQGFPMRFNLPGTARKRLLLYKGPCVKIKRRGMRKRKTCRGNIIAEDIKQISIKVLKEGDKKLVDMFPKKEGEKKVELLKKSPVKEEKKPEVKEESKKEKPKKEESKKEEPKKEEKKVEEKPKEESKKEEEKK